MINNLPVRIGTLPSDDEFHARHAADGDAVGTGGKLKELALLLLRHGVHH